MAWGHSPSSPHHPGPWAHPAGLSPWDLAGCPELNPLMWLSRWRAQDSVLSASRGRWGAEHSWKTSAAAGVLDAGVLSCWWFFFFLGVVCWESRASCMAGKHSTNWAGSPAPSWHLWPRTLDICVRGPKLPQEAWHCGAGNICQVLAAAELLCPAPVFLTTTCASLPGWGGLHGGQCLPWAPWLSRAAPTSPLPMLCGTAGKAVARVSARGRWGRLLGLMPTSDQRAGGARAEVVGSVMSPEALKSLEGFPASPAFLLMA